MSENKECWALFHGKGGYAYQNTEANELLTVGAKYKIIGGEIGRSSTSLVLEGQTGFWNSVMFDFDHDSAPLEKVYLGVPRNLISAAMKSYPAEMDGNTYFNSPPEKQTKTCHLTVTMEEKQILEVLARASKMTLEEYVGWVLKEKAAEILNN